MTLAATLAKLQVPIDVTCIGASYASVCADEASWDRRVEAWKLLKNG